MLSLGSGLSNTYFEKLSHELHISSSLMFDTLKVQLSFQTGLSTSVSDVTDAMSFFNESEPAATSSEVPTTSATKSRPHRLTNIPPSKKPKMSAADTMHSNRALQADVLQLQQEVYSGMKEMVSEVKSMSQDMRAMISEARLAIFEYRLTLRGANVANINVEAPPGIEEHLKH